MGRGFPPLKRGEHHCCGVERRAHPSAVSGYCHGGEIQRAINILKLEAVAKAGNYDRGTSSSSVGIASQRMIDGEHSRIVLSGEATTGEVFDHGVYVRLFYEKQLYDWRRVQ